MADKHMAMAFSRSALLVLSAAAVLTVVACGGGGDSASPPTVAPATSYTEGPILGFGSVIVGGVRWDDSTATVSDADGATHDRSALKLGMLVAVDGTGLNTAAGTGSATHIKFGSETVGPIASVSAATSRFVVLGVTIEVTSTTVFDANITGGLAGLTPGAVVEVHGLPDTTRGVTVATRVELKPGATSYRLRGTVASLNATAKTFRIGSELISYASVVAPKFADGQVVRLRLSPTPVAGAWVVMDARNGAPKPADSARAHIEGVITTFASAKSFSIGGVTVDATSATFPDGQAAVVLGARVEVKGATVSGSLVANSVEVADTHVGTDARMFEVHGAISALDTTAKTFVLRGITVNYGATVAYRDGTAATLANGKNVEVKGLPSADRTKLVASSIKFE